MSDDAFQPDSRRPLPSDPPPGDPYAAAFGSGSDPRKAKGRLLIPGIFVILIGLLNLVPGVGCAGFGLMMQKLPDAEFEKAVKQQNPQNWAEMEKQGYGIKTIKDVYLYSGLGIGVISLVLGLLAILGGAFMIAGRSFFLCSVGALAAMLSPGGFCVLGLAAGIWAFIVLFSEDVRAAFRAA